MKKNVWRWKEVHLKNPVESSKVENLLKMFKVDNSVSKHWCLSEHLPVMATFYEPGEIFHTLVGQT